MRGRLGVEVEGVGSLLGLLVVRRGAELDVVGRRGEAFSLPERGEILRGGVGGRPSGLGKAFTRVPSGAEIVYERRWRREKMGLGERLGGMLVLGKGWHGRSHGSLATHECSVTFLTVELPWCWLAIPWTVDAVENIGEVGH